MGGAYDNLPLIILRKYLFNCSHNFFLSYNTKFSLLLKLFLNLSLMKFLLQKIITLRHYSSTIIFYNLAFIFNR